MTPEDRFLAKIDRQDGGCWLWTAGCDPGGYGRWQRDTDGPKILAHRFAYELFVGPIPEGLELDHLCRVRRCVRPDHLEPVTRRENLMRSPIAPAAVNAAKTHCKRGHEFTAENTVLLDGGRRRNCRTCVTAAQRKRRAA